MALVAKTTGHPMPKAPRTQESPEVHDAEGGRGGWGGLGGLGRLCRAAGSQGGRGQPWGARAASSCMWAGAQAGHLEKQLL